MKEIPTNNIVDLRGNLCPMNWVKTKLLLEEMGEGELLEVILDEGEPIHSVPRSARNEGHKIVKIEPLGDKAFKLIIKRGAD